MEPARPGSEATSGPAWPQLHVALTGEFRIGCFPRGTHSPAGTKAWAPVEGLAQFFVPLGAPVCHPALVHVRAGAPTT